MASQQGQVLLWQGELKESGRVGAVCLVFRCHPGRWYIWTSYWSHAVKYQIASSALVLPLAVPKEARDDQIIAELLYKSTTAVLLKDLHI